MGPGGHAGPSLCSMDVTHCGSLGLSLGPVVIQQYRYRQRGWRSGAGYLWGERARDGGADRKTWS